MGRRKGRAKLAQPRDYLRDGPGGFQDAFAIEWLDYRRDADEPRFAMLGMVEHRLLFVAYTVRGTEFVSFQPGKPSRMNDADTHEDNSNA